MGTPEKILKLKRIRDGKIVLLWARHGWSTEKIAEKYKLSQRRIEQILYANHAFVEFNKDWEKKKRIARLQQWIKEAPKPESNALTLQQELRTELEGDEKSSGGGETKIIIIRPSDSPVHLNENGNGNGRTENTAQTVSRSIPV